MVMKKRLIITTLILILSFSVVIGVAGQNMDGLSYYTEEYPPFNFQGETELEGITIDLLELIFKEAGIDFIKSNIQLLPWARGYSYLQNNTNTVLFATTRTEEREDQFKWVGPIIAVRISVISKKSENININTEADLQQYKTAAVRNDVGHQLLLSKGVPESTIEIVADSSYAAKMIDAGRVALWAYDINVAKWIMKENGIDPNEYEEVFVLKEAELFYALSKDIPDSVVAEFQTALDRISRAERDEIEARYLK